VFAVGVIVVSSLPECFEHGVFVFENIIVNLFTLIIAPQHDTGVVKTAANVFESPVI
jgi:hypothetical protein